MPIILLQRILREAIFDIFYFPIWWYTAGAKYAFLSIWQMIRFGNANLAPGLWFKNIFVPMYGQYDIQGRIISFVLRLVQIIVRSLALLFWFVFCLAMFCFWLLIPLVVIWGFTQIF